MTHYAHCFTINRLRLGVRLGYEEPERKKPQPVEADIRLYFPSAPSCVQDDFARFIDYAGLCSRVSQFCGSGEFRLLEFLTGAVFAELRACLDSKDASDIRLWLKLTKCAAPVPYLEGGASYVMTDLPPGASVVDVR